MARSRRPRMNQKPRSYSSDPQKRFAAVEGMRVPRSSFDRTHGHKSTFDAGYLIPFYVDEILPGDTVNMRATIFARLATPIYPVMDNVYLETFFFFVPARLVWDNWQKFCGEQENPGDSIDFEIPQVFTAATGGFAEMSIFDYMGLPTKVDGINTVSALPFRAYNLIWNEFFRSQDLQSSQMVYRTDGPDSFNNYNLLRRGKRHDYFTSCLPWPAKGGQEVSLPLGTTAPVSVVPDSSGRPGFKTAEFPGQTLELQMNPGGIDQGVFHTGPNSTATPTDYLDWADPALEGVADLSQATAVTINALREASTLQQFFEREARGGTRYTEQIRSMFGVVSPDQRLQRPEYLGGGRQFLNIVQVAATINSTTGFQRQLGDLAGFGQSMGQHGFMRSFVEHGFVIGLVSARAELSYQQGLDRMWSRKTRFDFYWPPFANLGEQEVLNKEIFYQGPDVLNTDNPPTPVDDDAFGYNERFSEYKYKPSRITARMRSNAAQSLDSWHLAQDFGALPKLDGAFIQDTPPIDRVIAIQSEPHFIMDSELRVRHARPIPVYSTPGIWRF